MKKFGKEATLIIIIFSLLIFVNFTIMHLKEQISMISLFEIISVALVVVLYYFIINREMKIASKIIEKRLMNVEKKFEEIDKKLDEDANNLKKLLIGFRNLRKKKMIQWRVN